MKNSISRRRFLKYSGFSVAALTFPAAVFSLQRNPYSGLNSDNYLGSVTVETEVHDSDIFLEGPAVDGEGNVFFTNIPANEILRWDPKARELSVFRENSNSANGLAFDKQGRLLACEGGGRVTRTNMQTGEIEVLADSYNSKELQSPNDLCFDGQGRIYFSSRGGEAGPDMNKKAVYRIDGDGSVHQLLSEPDVQMPNGLVTSPDHQTFYLIEAHSGEGKNRHLRAYDLHEDGSLSNRRILYDFAPGRSGDGMAIDRRGNIYVAAGLHSRRGTSETLDTRPGIHVFSPRGELIAYRETPLDTITNCTFGGENLKTLYAVCGDLLVSMPTRIPGDHRYKIPG
jgi:gluconolactonase